MESYRRALSALGLILALAPAWTVGADLYRYQDESGQWVFTDRKPDTGQAYEKSVRSPAAQTMPGVEIQQEEFSAGTRVIARNTCACPMQVAVWLSSADNVSVGNDANGATAVLGAGAVATVLELRPERK